VFSETEVCMNDLQVINNMSRATSKSLESEFLLQNQNIFMVEKITERVTQYLYMNSHVDSKRTRPLCYLKDISQAGPKIAIMCNINLLVSYAFTQLLNTINQKEPNSILYWPCHTHKWTMCFNVLPPAFQKAKASPVHEQCNAK
jgi:hypothetical protein